MRGTVNNGPGNRSHCKTKPFSWSDLAVEPSNVKAFHSLRCLYIEFGLFLSENVFQTSLQLLLKSRIEDAAENLSKRLLNCLQKLS
jgi:hypothetical protein